MDKIKPFFIFSLFLVYASCFALQANTEYPKIKEGILDLRNFSLSEIDEIGITGEWEFYWKQFLSYSDFYDSIHKPEALIKQVPSVWNHYTIDGETLPAHGYATFRIKVYHNESELFAFKLANFSSSFKLFIDDYLVESGGIIANNGNESVPGYQTGVRTFQAPADSFDIILQISNFEYCKGGMWNNFTTLGTADNIVKAWNRKIEILLILIGCMGIIAIYHFGLFYLNRSFTPALYFTFFCIIIAVRAMFVNEIYILHYIPNFNWNALVKIEYLPLMVGTIFLVLFINDVFSEFKWKWYPRIVIAINTVLALLVLITSVNFFTQLLLIFQAALLLGLLYSLIVIFNALLKRKREAQILVLGILILVVTIVNDILLSNRVVNTTYLTHYGFMFFIVSQAQMLSYTFQKMFKETKQLAENLEHINQNLEQKVQERAKAIWERNKRLRDQNKEIQAQKDIITDSITYAKRIQQAVLPSGNIFAGHLRDHFILYMPKDIVSGDFYWFSTKENKVIIVAADCTGHGVPGAFMSMLGMAFLTEISQSKHVHTPADILDLLREKVKQSLHQYDKDCESKDGMDMALCMYDPETKIMEFAGAYSPLYLIRDNEILIHKGDKQPIAVHQKEVQFTNREIKIEPNDRFYVFSDGYMDQMHGNTYKKFNVKNFKELLLKVHREPMEKQREKLLKTIKQWRADGPQIDDILVIGFQL
jgi:serine phosphatase RsbU (regulator of sigma subunit)